MLVVFNTEDKKTRFLGIRLTEEEYQELLVKQKELGLKTLSETVKHFLKKQKEEENLLNKSLRLNQELLNKNNKQFRQLVKNENAHPGAISFPAKVKTLKVI